MTIILIYFFRGQYVLIVIIILVLMIVACKMRKVFRLIGIKKKNDFVEQQVGLLNVQKNKMKNTKPSAPLLLPV